MTPSRRPAFLRSRRLVFGAAGVTCLAAASLLLVLWTRHDDAPAARPGPPPTVPLAALAPPDATPALATDAQVAIATAPTPSTLVKKPVTKHPVIKRKSVAKKTAVTKKPAVATKKTAIAPKKKKSFVAPKKKPKDACASLSCL